MPKICLAEALRRGFTPDWRAHDAGGLYSPAGYGRYEHVVFTNTDGEILFDCIVFHQCPGVFAWVFTRHPDNGIQSVLIIEQRDAVAPDDGVSAAYFLGPPRGNVDPGETAMDAAVREACEETGAQAVRGVWSLGEVVTNETLTGNFTPIVAVEVAPDQFGAIEEHGGEHILGAQSYTDADIDALLLSDMTPEGVCCNSAVFLSCYTRFRAAHAAGRFDTPSEYPV